MSCTLVATRKATHFWVFSHAINWLMMFGKVPKSQGQGLNRRFAGDSNCHIYLFFTLYFNLFLCLHHNLQNFGTCLVLTAVTLLVWSGVTSEVLIVLFNSTQKMLQCVCYLQVNTLHLFYRAWYDL